MELTPKNKRILRQEILDHLMRPDGFDKEKIKQLLNELAIEIENHYYAHLKIDFQNMIKYGTHLYSHQDISMWLNYRKINLAIINILIEGSGCFAKPIFIPSLPYDNFKKTWPMLFDKKYNMLFKKSNLSYSEAKNTDIYRAYDSLIRRANTLEDLLEYWPAAANIKLSQIIEKTPKKPIRSDYIKIIQTTNIG